RDDTIDAAPIMAKTPMEILRSVRAERNLFALIASHAMRIFSSTFIVYLQLRRTYQSNRRAVTGSILAARNAGITPAIIPTATETTVAIKSREGEIKEGRKDAHSKVVVITNISIE